MKRILIICGGQSPEHAISIRSCRNILAAMDRTKYQVIVMGIALDGTWTLLDETTIPDKITESQDRVAILPGGKDCFKVKDKALGAFDVAFPILHGPNGEDGSVQGLLKVLGIPFVGCDLLSSAVSMDKDFAKRLLHEANVPVSKWLLFSDSDSVPSYSSVAEKLSPVLFVKPANMGSSVGVHRVSSTQEWTEAIHDAFQYDEKVLIEEEVHGREVECAVLGNKKPVATKVGEVLSGNFYSYDEKYEASSVARVVIPAELDDGSQDELKQVALKSYAVLGCAGLARVDMFLAEDGKIVVNEVNTMPGFTSISMYPKLWEEEGISYTELIDKLIDLALERG